MVRVPVEVREGDDLFEVTVYADTISEAVGIARSRFPGRDVRVVFPIDGEEFFGGRGTEAVETVDLGRRRLMPGRVT
jgi:hypothetical protein